MYKNHNIYNLNPRKSYPIRFKAIVGILIVCILFILLVIFSDISPETKIIEKAVATPTLHSPTDNTLRNN
jgi:hypothetical protein